MSIWPLLGRVSLSVALVGILAMPAAAFEEKASKGSTGTYDVPDDPGAHCVYEHNRGSKVDELDLVRINPVTVEGPEDQRTWVGFRYILKANESPYDDGVYETVFKSPITKARASQTKGAEFTGWYDTGNDHDSEFQVQLVFVYYEPGSKTKVAGRTRGLVEVYGEYGLKAGVLENGSIGDPGACAAEVRG